MDKKTIPYKLATNARQSEGELLMPVAYDTKHQVFRLAHLMREDGGPFLQAGRDMGGRKTRT
jgi:hypothetical protein